MRPLSRLCLVLLLVAMVTATAASPGSWLAQAEPLRAAVPGRVYRTTLVPGQSRQVQGKVVTSVNWQYELRGHGARQAEVKLCHPQRCVAAAGRGRTEAFAGLAADQAFRLQVRLPTAASGAAELTRVQLIVNYQ